LDVNTTDIFSLEAVGFHFCFGMVYFNDFTCKISGYKVDFVVLRMKLLVGGGLEIPTERQSVGSAETVTFRCNVVTYNMALTISPPSSTLKPTGKLISNFSLT